MKKMLAGILAGMMLCALVSCADAPPDDPFDYTAPSVTTTESATPSDTTAVIEPPEVPEPTLTVTEEIDWEHKAVKITLSGDGMYYFPSLRGELIENYQYRLGVNSSGRMQDFPLPMESPVVAYYPISSYIRKSNALEICKVDENGKVYREDYTFSLDIASMLSDEPILLQDEFLHAAMTAYFGGEYSERDLLTVGILRIQYNRMAFQSYDREPNHIQILKELSDTPVNYDFSDFFDVPNEEAPSVISAAMLEDLKLFRGLFSLELSDKYDPDRRALYLKIAQETARGYEVTENTWSQ